MKVSLVPTDGVPRVDLEFAARIYAQKFGEYLEVERLERGLELAAFPCRTTAQGNQNLAPAILKAGSLMGGKRGSLVVVLTSADIYTTGTNYIFGLATVGSAVVSSARIDPSFWRQFDDIFHHARLGRPFFEKQYAKVLIHELGHTLGVPHCWRRGCAMHYSNSPVDLYRKGEAYCDDCWRKVTSSIRKRVPIRS